MQQCYTTLAGKCTMQISNKSHKEGRVPSRIARQQCNTGWGANFLFSYRRRYLSLCYAA